MKKIKIFLASSDELIEERRKFEIEIYRKAKKWFDKGVFLHLEVWEDLSARMSESGSQTKYNTLIEETDLFVLLAHTKVGMYTAEEFKIAFGQFQSTQKPFIYTYFKDNASDPQNSLDEFKNELKNLKHYYSTYSEFHDLWNQFNKELDLLLEGEFKEHSGTNQQQLLEEKNVVRGGLKNIKRIKIGDKEVPKTEQYTKKNILEGNVEGADEFILGDGH